jgi:serine/threonine protein kinase
LIFYRTNDDYILQGNANYICGFWGTGVYGDSYLQRFQQEARILSSLNHPNLLAIFDVGSQDGSHYLVSELLEGRTLRERLSVGPLSLRKAVEYGVQMANGCRMSLSYILSRIHVH